MSNPLSSTVVAATQANTKLIKTVSELIKVANDLTLPTGALNDLVDQIAQKQSELSALETQFEEDKRSRTVTFDLDLKQDAFRKISEVLTEQGKSAIDTTELNKLRGDLQTLTDKFEDALESEVGKIKGMAEASKAAALRQKDLELAASSAEVKAQINSLVEKNALLTKQVDDYKAQIAADRDARIQEAKARGNPVVTVASGK